MARTLDSVVTRKTRRKVFYTIFAGSKAEWRIHQIARSTTWH